MNNASYVGVTEIEAKTDSAAVKWTQKEGTAPSLASR